jgi:hypothetical protein
VEFVAIFSKNGKEINEEYIRKTVLNWKREQKWNQRDRKKFLR